MPTLASSNILTPKSRDEFENITLDAAKIRWASPNFFRNGRQGQKQDGVDIFSAPAGKVSIGVQCKNTIHKLTKALVRKEITNAESFTPPLNELYIATTASCDATMQKHVREISKARTEVGKFSVDLLFWEGICGKEGRSVPVGVGQHRPLFLWMQRELADKLRPYVFIAPPRVTWTGGEDSIITRPIILIDCCI